MSPGAVLRGRRNRREKVIYRVKENSRTHGQIQGAVDPPPPPPPYRARARSRQHTPPPPHPLLGAISALCPRALNTHTTPLPYSVTEAYPGFQRGGCLRSGAIREGGWGGGGVLSVFGPIRKAGGGGVRGGGGGGGSASVQLLL